MAKRGNKSSVGTGTSSNCINKKECEKKKNKKRSLKSKINKKTVLDANEYLDFLKTDRKIDFGSGSPTCINTITLFDSEGLCNGLTSADVSSRLMSIDWK